jgi:peptidoglycan L-alanyl-D-glutamate endopeptidase CwlK
VASRDLADLHPVLRVLAQQHIDICAASGVRLLIYCTWRSPDEQAALYAQGRRPLHAVNALRKAVGLSAITDGENRRRVTNARTSRHSYMLDGAPAALAYDCCPLDDAGRPDWSGEGYRWQLVAEIGKRLGLRWGGRWKTPRDRPHFEIPEPQATEVVES